MHPQIGRTHNLKTLPKKVTDTSYLGGVWAGAGTKTGSWTTIIGYWKIPTVSKPTEPQGTEGGWNSSSWLGLDGFFVSNDVVQAGSSSSTSAHPESPATLHGTNGTRPRSPVRLRTSFKPTSL